MGNSSAKCKKLVQAGPLKKVNEIKLKEQSVHHKIRVISVPFCSLSLSLSLNMNLWYILECFKNIPL